MVHIFKKSLKKGKRNRKGLINKHRVVIVGLYIFKYFFKNTLKVLFKGPDGTYLKA